MSDPLLTVDDIRNEWHGDPDMEAAVERVFDTIRADALRDAAKALRAAGPEARRHPCEFLEGRAAGMGS